MSRICVCVNRPRGKESTEVRISQNTGKESENSYQKLKRSLLLNEKKNKEWELQHVISSDELGSKTVQKTKKNRWTIKIRRTKNTNMRKRYHKYLYLEIQGSLLKH